MFHGLLSFLLDTTDPYAAELRQRFVFKLVPMLNPDGVVRGHFRSDTFGVNLNRAYDNPSPTRHPSVFAVKAVLRQMAALLTPLPSEPKSKGLWMYLDLHAYSARQGCYLLGNTLVTHREAKTLAFTHLAQLYNPQFNVGACSFGGKKALGEKGNVVAEGAGLPYTLGEDPLEDARAGHEVCV